MNESIVNNWNSVVKPEDTVYHFGDFSFGNPRKFIDRLNGKILFIKCSHD